MSARGAVLASVCLLFVLAAAGACGDEGVRPLPLRVFCAVQEYVSRENFRISEPGSELCRDGLRLPDALKPRNGEDAQEGTDQSDGSESPAK